MMKNKKLSKYLALLLLIMQSCTEKHDEGQFIYKKTSSLASMPLDSFQKKFKLDSSYSIRSLGLVLYSFNAISTYPDNAIKSYMLVCDSSDNSFVISRAKPGMYDHNPQELQVINEKSVARKIDWLRVKQIPMELKIESILNSLNLNTKKNLNEKNLDSLFRYVFANSIAHRVENKHKFYERISSQFAIDSAFKNMQKLYGTTNYHKYSPNLYFNEYNLFLDTNRQKTNFFIYTNNNYDEIIAVSVNEEMMTLEKSELLYKMFTDDDRFFKIRIYDSP